MSEDRRNVEMTDPEFFEALFDCYANDVGIGGDSHDETIRERLKRELARDRLSGRFNSVTGNGFYPRLSEFVRTRLLNPPYGVQDVAEFIRWLDEKMGHKL